MLTDPVLQDGKVVGTIPLEGARIQKADEKLTSQYCFEILTPSRSLLLCTETRTEMNGINGIT